MFAVLLYNIWRLTDFLLKAGIDGEMDYAPVLTAGGCVEIVVSHGMGRNQSNSLVSTREYNGIQSRSAAPWISAKKSVLDPYRNAGLSRSSQSSRKDFRPLSVRGWSNILSATESGSVAMSAPAFATS